MCNVQNCQMGSFIILSIIHSVSFMSKLAFYSLLQCTLVTVTPDFVCKIIGNGVEFTYWQRICSIVSQERKDLEAWHFFFKAGTLSIINFHETLNSALQSGFYLALLKMFNIHKNIHVQKKFFCTPNFGSTSGLIVIRLTVIRKWS